jgi:hypothetical protein
VAHDEELRFDPAVVPRLRTVFTDALAKVDAQIKLADAELRVTPSWAGDPISGYAGQRVNSQSEDALDALRTHREALDAVVVKLGKAAGDYRESEADKNVSMSQHHEG